MDRYNIRQDLEVRWTLLYSNKTPFPLSGYTLRMKYIAGRGENPIPESDITVDGNVVVWQFKADHQIASGAYNLSLELFLGDQYVTKFFSKDAFALGCHGDGSGVVEITGYADHLFTAYRLAMDAAERVPNVDDELSLESKNPVQNKTITAALMSYYKASMSASFSGVRGKEGTVTFSSSLSFNGNNIPGYTIKYYKDEARTQEIHSGDKDTITGSSKTYYGTIDVKGVKYYVSASVSAYYNTYYGFTTYDGVSFGLSGLTAINVPSAQRTYTKTNGSASTPIFVIAVPSGVTAPSRFSMGGAPAALVSVPYTIDGISYTMFYIGDYDKNVTLEITAS